MQRINDFVILQFIPPRGRGWMYKIEASSIDDLDNLKTKATKNFNSLERDENDDNIFTRLVKKQYGDNWGDIYCLNVLEIKHDEHIVCILTMHIEWW